MTGRKEHRIQSIFFDLGDTLRIIRKDPAYAQDARRQICRLLKVPENQDDYFDQVILPRYAAYRTFAAEHCFEAPGQILWTRWLAPDAEVPITPELAEKLCLLFRRTKGERVPAPGCLETIRELKARGYTLGIVTNLVGTTEVGAWLAADGIRDCFSCVVQSSECYVRKPHPAIFYKALEETGTAPECACFVGDTPEQDILGARTAGFGRTIAVHYPWKKWAPFTEENRPDAVISSLLELLTMFP